MNLLSADVSVAHYLVVGAVLFVLGAVCMATKRNALGVLMGIELVLNGANINFVAFGSKLLREKTLGLDGELIALFVIVLAAAEACSHQIIDLYAKPNMTVQQIHLAFERDWLDPIRDFSVACRKELLEIAGGSRGGMVS